MSPSFVIEYFNIHIFLMIENIDDYNSYESSSNSLIFHKGLFYYEIVYQV
jgi:hypothetical protein